MSLGSSGLQDWAVCDGNSLMTVLLRDSPMEIHRKLYQDNVMKRGGSYSGSVVPPPYVFDRIMEGEAFAFQIEDGLASNKHKLHKLDEAVTWGPSGYYFDLHLPIADEILDALWRFRDGGVVKKVSYVYMIGIYVQ